MLGELGLDIGYLNSRPNHYRLPQPVRVLQIQFR